jgi:hypothetical protein
MANYGRIGLGPFLSAAAVLKINIPRTSLLGAAIPLAGMLTEMTVISENYIFTVHIMTKTSS